MSEEFILSKQHTEQERQEISYLIADLRKSDTIGDFEMRVQLLKEEYGVDIDESYGSLTKLRRECLERNKKILEVDIATARTDAYRKMRQIELEEVDCRLEEMALEESRRQYVLAQGPDWPGRGIF